MASIASSPFPGNGLHSQRSVIWAVAISAALHLMAFGLLFGLPEWGRARRMPLPAGVINVAVVSIDDLGGPIAAPAAPAPAPKPAAKPKAEVTTQPAPKPKPVAKPKPAVKKNPEVSVATKQAPAVKKAPQVKKWVSLKKKTFKPDRSRRKAIKNVAKRVDTERPDTVNSAIADLKARVARGEGADRSVQMAKATPGTGTAKPGLGGLGGQGGAIDSFMLVYQVNMGQRIQHNWAFSQRLAGNAEGLVAEVVVKVARDGRIFDVRFAKKSGNDYLDESALKAIKKTDRFDPLPDPYRRSTFEAGYRFSSSGKVN